MIDPATTQLAVKSAIGFLGEYLKKKLVARGSNRRDAESHIERLRESLNRKMIEILNWSSSYQIFGMASPASIDDWTISIALARAPRSFRGPTDQALLVFEKDLLNDLRHYVILGDPGSGKTTTIKRLIRRLLSSPQSKRDIFQYPVLLRLRDLHKETSLFVAIADYLGIRPTTPLDSNNFRIREHELNDLIPEFLNETQAVVLLDGLDEVELSMRGLMRKQIEQLALRLNKSKIIVSCRSGETSANIERFSIVEICPLENKQILQIAGFWLQDTEPFITALAQMPCADLADRPLLLAELILLFKRYGYLPEQASIVYEKLIRIILEDWDAQRDIRRESKYAGFTPDRKMEFLSALSYHLTYIKSTKIFSEGDLLKSYRAIRESFGLPEHEALQVVNEIQSHTGLIAMSSGGLLEFSHLSLQEYLCAHYLVREPFPYRMTDYIRLNTAPLAVAVGLSSHPSKWLAALILLQANYQEMQLGPVSALLSRLLVERPLFVNYVPLGCSILRLYHSAQFSWGSVELTELIDRFVSTTAISASIGAAIQMYAVCPGRSKKNVVWLEPLPGYSTIDGFEVPSVGAVSTVVLKEIIMRNPLGNFWKDNEDRLHDLTPTELCRIVEEGDLGSGET